MEKEQRLIVVVRGQVQGVGYRMFVQRHARRLGLTGWVRNEPDGAVKLLAEGPAPALALLEQPLRHGPIGARVSSLESSMEEASGQFLRFDIID